ncbi:MAG: hypothetical protein IJS36_00235, partial [Kiritimatiellae bacterium]|nr:hypothetical protein [Kiritimatiellia bacterium]
ERASSPVAVTLSTRSRSTANRCDEPAETGNVSNGMEWLLSNVSNGMVLIIIYIPVPAKQVPVLQPIPSHSTPLKQGADRFIAKIRRA